MFTLLLFLLCNLGMKRSLSVDEYYFSDNSEDDDELVRALDEFEQVGGALNSPLFSFDLAPVGRRRRWRNVVQGQSFRATLHQEREPHASDNIGEELTNALRRSIGQQLRQMQVHPNDSVNFSMHANGFQNAFQSINFSVGEFIRSSLRIDTLFQMLAEKLNSNESFDANQSFDVLISVVAMPRAGSKPRKHNVGRKCLSNDLKKKRCLIPISNKDELCCARAIVTMRAHCHKDDDAMTWTNMRKGYPVQTAEAKHLHRQAQVDEGPCGIEELQKFQKALGTSYQLLVMSFCKPFMLIFKGPKAPHQIRLVKSNTHYDGCTSFPAFINQSYYCLDCEKGFNTDSARAHRCNGTKCVSCERKNCEDNEANAIASTRCPICNCLFYGPDCLMFHRLGKDCGKYKTCPECQSKYLTDRKRHHCGIGTCPSCKEKVFVAEHKCFITPVEVPQSDEESSDEEDDQSSLENALFVYADIEALQLVDRTFEPNMLCYRTSEEEEIHCLKSSSCCLEFLHILDDLTDLPDTDDERPVIVIFHNLKGFDGIFILRELYDQQRTVTNQLTVGAKVLSFKSGPIIFKDSLCFLPMPLAAFPSTFGIKELKKGYFPHAFNIPCNQDYVGRIPDEHYYEPEEMKSEEAKEAFEVWHAEQVRKNVQFDFQKEMEAYCKSDVALLQAGCEAFCKEFEQHAHFNPMAHCVTIASACNLYWRREHLQQFTITIEPMQGWRGAEVNQSLAAFQWLYYCESQIPKEGASADRIKHARNGGEQTVLAGQSPVFVDGFDTVTNTVYEFHGCFWHGCRSCFITNRARPWDKLGSRSFEEVRVATEVKMNSLRSEGFVVNEMWECEWKTQMASNTRASTFVKTLRLAPPLDPRDAFFGGRTGAVSLFAKADEKAGEKIAYVDVTSLYPWVNKNANYPIGHPKIITNPGHRNISLYFGVACVDILPPANLFHPVLPVRSGKKLTFPLCSSCVQKEQAKPMLSRSEFCCHTDEERTLRGTWCTPELEESVKQGYKILVIHEVWHFPQNQQVTGLFRDYVNTWLKIKQESGGWPSWCDTDDKKQTYIDRYKEREGIDLEREQIKKNPGRKATAKLMLNSFWGKFGERQNKPKTEAITSPSVLFKRLTGSSLNISQIRLCNDDLLEIVSTSEDDAAMMSTKTNIFIAAFTTCWARLKLYSYLTILQQQVLYYDTDSVIFKKRPDQPDIPIGDFLGEMTNELDKDDYITEFASGGAKNYGYKTHKGKVECKVRGFTLNVRGSKTLNYDVMKRNILAEIDAPLQHRRTVKVTNPNHFKRNVTEKKIALINQAKAYGLVFDKRVIDKKTKHSFPFGYKRVINEVDNLVDLFED